MLKNFRKTSKNLSKKSKRQFKFSWNVYRFCLLHCGNIEWRGSARPIMLEKSDKYVYSNYLGFLYAS